MIATVLRTAGTAMACQRREKMEEVSGAHSIPCTDPTNPSNDMPMRRAFDNSKTFMTHLQSLYSLEHGHVRIDNRTRVWLYASFAIELKAFRRVICPKPDENASDRHGENQAYCKGYDETYGY